MSTYIKPGQPLEFDNAPDWLVGYMRYRRTVLGNTRTSVMTVFGAMREFCQWRQAIVSTKRQPQSAAQLRTVDILEMPLSAVLGCDRNDIETYLYYLTDVQENDAATRNKKLAVIRGFYDYLIDQREALGVTLESNPAGRIRRTKTAKKLPVFLPDADQQAFLSGIVGENETRDYALFLLMLSAGLRISEVVGINMGDVDMEAKTIRVCGKGNKERTVYLTDACAKAIQDYVSGYRAAIPAEKLDTDALFVSRRYCARLTARSIEKSMHKYAVGAKLGGKGYTPHKLRHTTATTLAKDGVDLLVIQSLLGHSNPATTEIYTHLGSEDIAQAIRASSLPRLGSSNEE